MSSRSRQRGKSMYDRSVHRQRSHDEAHSLEATLPQVLDHPLVPQGEPALVHNQPELQSHTAKLGKAGRFAYDTEFIGEHSYHPKLCLIQTASVAEIAIIDPLSPGLELEQVWLLLADDSIEKVVHAGDQDLEPVYRHLGRPPSRVLDTQVLAAFAGLGYPVGMARLVQTLLSIEVGSGLTFTQWDRRPLSHVQTLYAANDVRYLLLLSHHLLAMLSSNGNLEWALDECRQRCASEHFHINPVDQRSRIRGVDGLNPRQMAVLTELIAWRESAAEAQNVPPRSLLKDAILMDMARNPVKSVHELNRVPGLPRPVESRWGRHIVSATAAGMEAPLPAFMVDRPFDRFAHRRLTEKVWDEAAVRCRHRHIEPAIAVSKREVGHYLRLCELGVPIDQAAGRLIKGWRRELFGDVFERH